MSIVYTERNSEAPYVETITWGQTVTAASPIRPAEINWHLVFSKRHDRVYPLVVGPWTTAGSVTYDAGAEILWIRFRPGVFMPHLTPRHLLNMETALPQASDNTFWLKGAAWQFPNVENVDTFVKQLMRAEVLVCDPVVTAALQNRPQAVSERTVRHRFLQTTGLSQNYMRQVQRAHQAAALLRQGVSIADTMYDTGYYDQPHLTRALKQFIGYTPAQIAALHPPQ